VNNTFNQIKTLIKALDKSFDLSSERAQKILEVGGKDSFIASYYRGYLDAIGHAKNLAQIQQNSLEFEIANAKLNSSNEVEAL
jgi:hypothetical protein